jgi:alpha-ketoglutarate-dependent 2,4-dichlorophenoxyacetate dioxygenase
MVLPSRSRNASPPSRRELVHAHEWRRRDLVIWDNRQTMRRARRYRADEVRDMRRTTIAGDGPTAPQVEAA